MGYPKEFSIVLYILLVGLCSYLLCLGKLSGRAFIWSIIASAIAVALLHNLDVIQRISVKGQGIEAMADFQRIQKDIYAKADQVEQMTEAVAEMLADTATSQGRYGGSSDNAYREAQYRDKLTKTLVAAGTPKDRIDRILVSFAQWIPFDLQGHISQSVLEAGRKKGMSSQQMNDLSARLSKTLSTHPLLANLDAAEAMIKEEGLTSPEITASVHRYRTYLTTNEVLPSSEKRR
ncbi:MAG: hypothetical protein WBW84_13555 [Acidobacteriaceae bacterium]